MSFKKKSSYPESWYPLCYSKELKKGVPNLLRLLMVSLSSLEMKRVIQQSFHVSVLIWELIYRRERLFLENLGVPFITVLMGKKANALKFQVSLMISKAQD